MLASETLKHESNNVWNMYAALSNISRRLESAEPARPEVRRGVCRESIHHAMRMSVGILQPHHHLCTPGGCREQFGIRSTARGAPGGVALSAVHHGTFLQATLLSAKSSPGPAEE